MARLVLREDWIPITLPQFASFAGVVIWVYSNEHGVPHFHAKADKQTAVIAIDPSLQILAGSLPPAKMRKVVRWAPDHLEELKEKWLELNGEER